MLWGPRKEEEARKEREREERGQKVQLVMGRKKRRDRQTEREREKLGVLRLCVERRQEGAGRGGVQSGWFGDCVGRGGSIA